MSTKTCSCKRCADDATEKRIADLERERDEAWQELNDESARASEVLTTLKRLRYEAEQDRDAARAEVEALSKKLGTAEFELMRSNDACLQAAVDAEKVRARQAERIATLEASEERLTRACGAAIGALEMTRWMAGGGGSVSEWAETPEGRNHHCVTNALDSLRAAISSPPTPDPREERIAELLAWAESRKAAETANRPDENIYKRCLEGTWNQVIEKLRALLASPAPQPASRLGNPESICTTCPKLHADCVPPRDCPKPASRAAHAPACKRCGNTMSRYDGENGLSVYFECEACCNAETEDDE